MLQPSDWIMGRVASVPSECFAWPVALVSQKLFDFISDARLLTSRFSLLSLPVEMESDGSSVFLS